MGTSQRLYYERCGGKDHPHAYGDKKSTAVRKRSLSGSSPRVWGQEACSCSIGSNDRIIPTRMGTSNGDENGMIEIQDHPHAYGDKTMQTAHFRLKTGSSPRVWGQGIKSLIFGMHSRIIPTRMGTSCESASAEQTLRDHPHAYGNKRSRGLRHRTTKGSSPRVWGQVQKGV